MIPVSPGGPTARLNPREYAGVSLESIADAAAHLDPRRTGAMVFATREEEIDYLRDELERAGYDEGSNQKWDEATLGRVRKLKLLEEEAPRRGVPTSTTSPAPTRRNPTTKKRSSTSRASAGRARVARTWTRKGPRRRPEGAAPT